MALPPLEEWREEMLRHLIKNVTGLHCNEFLDTWDADKWLQEFKLHGGESFI